MCVVLLCLSLVRPNGQKYFYGAIAITYLVLPSATTKTFGFFPCDDFTDDGTGKTESVLRNDYRINCDGAGRRWWVALASIMVAVFPIGIPSFYTYILWKKRKNIMKPVAEREDDKAIAGIKFLWEPYKPEFWYWELIETLKRLMLTGVLGLIKGEIEDDTTFTQCGAAIIIATTYTVFLAFHQPFEELRDSVVAILAGAMMILTYTVAWLMKSRRTSLDDKYEADGLGFLMILCMGGILLVFILWAIRTMRETKKQQDDLALDVLKRVERGSWSDGHGGSVGSVGSVGVEVDGVEMGDLGGGGGRSSEFAFENPMRGGGGGVQGGDA